LSDASYAWHFDANLVARYMRRYATTRGVTRVEGKVVDVIKGENGNISGLRLATGVACEGDFFIDCSGFESLILGKALKVPFLGWSNFLPCDRAAACPTENTGALVPYTESTARDSGWTWRIPLQHRTGNGYVYASEFCDEQKAIDTLTRSVKGKLLAEPRVLKFTTGRRDRTWEKNCIALGLSAGFLEPLESTAIHLVMKGVRTFVELLPSHLNQQSLANEYNRIMNKLYEDIRDFIVLHYCTTERSDSEFWRWCKQMPIPDGLQNKIELFRETGRLFHNPDDLFKAPSWHAVFHGMGVVPKSYDPFVDGIDYEEISRILPQVKQLMHQMASGLPSHSDYLKRFLKIKAL
jgi:tryptophan 7-halogenase